MASPHRLQAALLAPLRPLGALSLPPTAASTACRRSHPRMRTAHTQKGIRAAGSSRGEGWNEGRSSCFGPGLRVEGRGWRERWGVAQPQRKRAHSPTDSKRGRIMKPRRGRNALYPVLWLVHKGRGHGKPTAHLPRLHGAAEGKTGVYTWSRLLIPVFHSCAALSLLHVK